MLRLAGCPACRSGTSRSPDRRAANTASIQGVPQSACSRILECWLQSANLSPGLPAGEDGASNEPDWMGHRAGISSLEGPAVFSYHGAVVPRLAGSKHFRKDILNACLS